MKRGFEEIKKEKEVLHVTIYQPYPIGARARALAHNQGHPPSSIQASWRQTLVDLPCNCFCSHFVEDWATLEHCFPNPHFRHYPRFALSNRPRDSPSNTWRRKEGKMRFLIRPRASGQLQRRLAGPINRNVCFRSQFQFIKICGLKDGLFKERRLFSCLALLSQGSAKDGELVLFKNLHSGEFSFFDKKSLTPPITCQGEIEKSLSLFLPWQMIGG